MVGTKHNANKLILWKFGMHTSSFIIFLNPLKRMNVSFNLSDFTFTCIFVNMYFSCYNGPSTQALICFSFGPYHSQTLYYFSFVCLFVLWLNKFEF